MNLIYLYDEFMRVPDHLEGQAVYIIDPEIQEGYEISELVVFIFQIQILVIIQDLKREQKHLL